MKKQRDSKKIEKIPKERPAYLFDDKLREASEEIKKVIELEETNEEDPK